MGTNGRLLQALRRQAAAIVAENGEQELWLVLQGDWGGQIYMTVPWKLVGRRARIATLLAELDQQAWPCNSDKTDGRSAYLYWKDAAHRNMEEEYGEGCGVRGGMGGGGLLPVLWIHDEFGAPVIPDFLEMFGYEFLSLCWPERIAELLDLVPEATHYCVGGGKR